MMADRKRRESKPVNIEDLVVNEDDTRANTHRQLISEHENAAFDMNCVPPDFARNALAVK